MDADDSIDNQLNDSANRRMWSNEEITSIIQAVRTRPFLYDKKHSDYKHHQKKEIAWDEIAASLENKNLTARECKRKWNTLRIQKRRILNQQTKRGKSKHTVLWQFFDALDFLMPHMEWIMTKHEASDAEFDETSDQYGSFTATEFEMKKPLKIDSDGEEEETDEHFSDDQQMGVDDIRTGANEHQHVTLQNVVEQQQQQQQQRQQQSDDQQQHMAQPDERLILPYHEIHHQQHQHQLQHGGDGGQSVVSPTSSSTEIIRLIHPAHGQTTSVTTSDGQTVYMTPTTTSQQQQLISIAHPVSLARFSHQSAIEAHMSVVDSTGGNSSSSNTISSGGGAGGTGGSASALVSVSNSALQSPSMIECSMTPTHSAGNIGQHQHQHHQSTPTSVGVVANGKHSHKQEMDSSPTAPCAAFGGGVGGGGGAGSRGVGGSGGGYGLNYFLMDIQMQMEMLNDIAQMELKVEIQKLLLDKRRQADSYK